RGNNPATHAGVTNGAVDLVGPVFLRLKSKVLDALVSMHHHVASLLQGGFEQIDAGDADGAICKAWIGGVGGTLHATELQPHGIHRDVDGAILHPEHPIVAQPSAPPAAPR